MKKNKFFIFAALCLVLCICFCSCSKKNDNNDQGTETAVFDIEELNSKISAEMKQAAIDDWKEFKSGEHSWASSKTPGTCIKMLNTWEYATSFLGFEPWNPLEDLTWLEKANCYGFNEVLEGFDEITHCQLMWQGKEDGTIELFVLNTGYTFGTIRVILNISQGYFVYPDYMRTDISTDKYSAIKIDFTKDHCMYNIHLIGALGEDAKKELSDAADRIIKDLDLPASL